MLKSSKELSELALTLRCLKDIFQSSSLNRFSKTKDLEMRNKILELEEEFLNLLFDKNNVEISEDKKKKNGSK